MSWFTYKLLQLRVHISPIFLGAVEEGIRIQLRTKVFRWVPELEGVFLAWKDIKVLSDSAAVQGDVLPLIEVPVRVKALVWCPEKGGLMQGVLVHKGSDFIAARVLGLWNAVIVKSHCNYLDKTKVNEGDTIRFRIQNLQIVNNLLSIEGSLLGKEVGFVDVNGDLHLPQLPNAAVSIAPSVNTNPKKRPRPVETTTESIASIGTSPSSFSSPIAEPAMKKKPKLKETHSDISTTIQYPESRKKDKKEKEKAKKHKDKKEKEKRKPKSTA